MQGGGIESGVVSTANSLAGTAANEGVGSNASAITLLGNGNYVVSNPKWNNGGSLPGAGSLTWASGATGVFGGVSMANSLAGSQINDALGGGGVVSLPHGRYLAKTPFWHADANTVVGAFTLGIGDSALAGIVDAGNSVIGSIPNGGNAMTYAYDASRDVLVVGRPGSNRITIFSVSDDVIFVDGFEGP
jgi:hypothetical protein